MSAPVLTVRFASVDAQSEALHRSILAGLPKRFEVTERLSANVVAMNASMASWPETAQAILETRPSAIALLDVVPADPRAIGALASAAADLDVTVLALSRYLADTAWGAAREKIAAGARTAVLVDTLAVCARRDGALGQALLEQLIVLADVLPDSNLTWAKWSDGHYLAGGLPAYTLCGACSSTRAPELRLHVVGLDVRWRVVFRGDAIAAPTEIVRFDSNGARVSRPRHDSGLRVGWSELHDAVYGDTAPSYGLALLESNSRRAQRIMSDAPETSGTTHSENSIGGR